MCTYNSYIYMCTYIYICIWIMYMYHVYIYNYIYILRFPNMEVAQFIQVNFSMATW